MPRTNLVESVLAACRADPLLAHGGGVVVAVSGGPDSTALLHALWRGASALRLELTAAHLDHAMRPGSAAGAQAVARLSADLGLPLVSRRLRRAPRSEDGARRARHSFLEEVAADTGARTVALGHTADDQAETVLLHLVRGSGLEGLAAMAPREGVRFRPLLGVWRSQIEDYCRRTRLDPVVDTSNQDPAFTRNRIRLEVLPLLERINPRVKESLNRLAAAAREEHDATVAMAERWLGRRRRTCDRRSFRRLPEGVQVEVLRRLWAAAGAMPTPGGASRIRQALRLITRPEPSGMMELGSGLHLHVNAESFRITG